MKFEDFKKGGYTPPQRREQPAPEVRSVVPSASSFVYKEDVRGMNFEVLQNNLNNCLSIIDNEVMKGYIAKLHDLPLLPLDMKAAKELDQVQFFRITELVYQENEFSVHKLATAFHALSNKPCTLVMMIQSDGKTNNFYLGVRSRDKARYSTGTMRNMLEQSLFGLFPGSKTEPYFADDMTADFQNMKVGCVSSVTCIADYKQEENSNENEDFIQGLEKFLISMRGKAFTAICIANNLTHQDLAETRRELEQVYTQISPFANIQYNFSINDSTSTTGTDTFGNSYSTTRGSSQGYNVSESTADGTSYGRNVSRSLTDTEGQNKSVGTGTTHTVGYSDGTSDTVTDTHTEGTSQSTTKTIGGQLGLNIGAPVKSSGWSQGINFIGGVNHFSSKTGPSISGSGSISKSKSVTRGTSTSDAHSIGHGTSHTDSVSDSISKNLTSGVSTSHAIGQSYGENIGQTQTITQGRGIQYNENTSTVETTNLSYSKALSATFGNSKAITLNGQNKALVDALQRLDKQLERLDECESLGMWDYAAYFLGESAAEAETAANFYHALISGVQSGLETSAVNTWINQPEQPMADEISKYVKNFLHPVFLFQGYDQAIDRNILVDPTSLSSTNELAIQMGLPRYSVKGLPVIEHASFAQEIVRKEPIPADEFLPLGKITYMGTQTGTDVGLDIESLSMHTFITGSTGSGKSNTIYAMLEKLYENDVNFLVVEPAKGEYKTALRTGERQIAVYGTNPNLKDTHILHINPFRFPDNIHVLEHLDRLVEIFNVCWPMYAAMPAILKDSIERAYEAAGWDLMTSQNKYDNRLYPTFGDVLKQIRIVLNESEYSSDNKGDYTGALVTRMRSLTNGINGLIFTSNDIPDEYLFDRNVIVDLSRVGSTETKSLIMGLLVLKLQEHRMQSSQPNEKLRHVTVLEEAHNLLKRTSTEQTTEGANLLGKSVEMLANSIAEMRTYGEGFIIADQSPGLLDMSVIRNTNTKIILRLPDFSDRELVGKAAGLNDNQIIELGKLERGVASITQSDWLEPVLCKIDKYDGKGTTFEAGQPDIPKLEETDSAKESLLECIMNREIYRKGDRVDIQRLKEVVIRSKLDAGVKCDFLDYIAVEDPDKEIESLRKLVFDFFGAEQAIKSAEPYDKIEDWERAVMSALEPSIQGYSQRQIEIVLAMIVYEKAERDIAYRNTLIRFAEFHGMKGSVI